MSDSDDWEAGLDSDNEEKKVAEEVQKKNAAFADEDQVDPLEEEKKKKEAMKKAAIEAQNNGRVKTSNKVDYDKEWEERQKKLTNAAVKPEIDTTGMTAQQKGLALEQAAEANMADQLFGGEDQQPNTVSKISLTNEKEYKNYGKDVASVLYSGSFPVRIEAFYKELSKDLPEHCDSKQIKKIADSLQSLYNAKLAEEKKNAKTKKKPAAGNKTMAYDSNRNNNMAMVADVMGAGQDDDDYQDSGMGFKREEEADYDFM